MTLDISWAAVGAITTLLTVAGGIALVLFRSALSREFVPLAAHAELSKRVSAVEHDLRAVPTHSDIAALSNRVGAVERGVAVVQEGVNGIRESIRRVELTTDRLLQHQLDREASQ